MLKPKTLFTIVKPKNARKSFALRYKNKKWKTVKLPEIAAVNKRYKSGELSYEQAEQEMRGIMGSLYAERNKLKTNKLETKVVVLPGNRRLRNRFIKETYGMTKEMRMANKLIQSEIDTLNSAISDLGDIPVDGDSDEIQDRIDDMYQSQPGSHEKRVTALNRIRKWLKLDPIFDLPNDNKDIKYVSESQLHEMLPHIEQTNTKILAGFLFYTGLSIGEAFAVTQQNIEAQKEATVVRVSKLMYPNGKLASTTTKATRNALVIPKGEYFINAWLALPDKKTIRNTIYSARIKEAAKKIGVDSFYLNFLRHSYRLHLISKGCTIDRVADSAGQSKEVCERYYASDKLSDDANVPSLKI